MCCVSFWTSCYGSMGRLKRSRNKRDQLVYLWEEKSQIRCPQTSNIQPAGAHPIQAPKVRLILGLEQMCVWLETTEATKQCSMYSKALSVLIYVCWLLFLPILLLLCQPRLGQTHSIKPTAEPGATSTEPKEAVRECCSILHCQTRCWGGSWRVPSCLPQRR